MISKDDWENLVFWLKLIAVIAFLLWLVDASGCTENASVPYNRDDVSQFDRLPY